MRGGLVSIRFLKSGFVVRCYPGCSHEWSSAQGIPVSCIHGWRLQLGLHRMGSENGGLICFGG